MRLALVVVAVALAFQPMQAKAWNGRGHMAVAGVAWDHLTPKARKRASELLQKNQIVQEQVKNLPAAERDRVAFMIAATWPDIIRNSPGYVGGKDYTPDNPELAKIIGYSDLQIHPGWHFINLPFSTDGTPTKDGFHTNAVTQISLATDMLGSSSYSDDAQSYGLVWLLHLVGDIHQPLHATARFSAETPTGDRGGGSVEVCNPGCNTNLHSFWDGAVGTSVKPYSVNKLINRLPAAPTDRVSILDPDAWAEESLEIAQSDVYNAPIGPGDGPYTLNAQYRFNAGATSEKRISLAGERLAAVINSKIGY